MAQRLRQMLAAGSRRLHRPLLCLRAIVDNKTNVRTTRRTPSFNSSLRNDRNRATLNGKAIVRIRTGGHHEFSPNDCDRRFRNGALSRFGGGRPTGWHNFRSRRSHQCHAKHWVDSRRRRRHPCPLNKAPKQVLKAKPTRPSATPLVY
jgi:hypothetical protein